MEDDVILDCPAKHRMNPKFFKDLTWLIKGSGFWTEIANLSNSSNKTYEKGVRLHGNGSLVLPRGRAEGQATYKCEVTKTDERRPERHEVQLKNTKCRANGNEMSMNLFVF